MTSSPQQATAAPPEDPEPDSGNWLALLAEFALVIGFTYSNDVVEFAMDLANRRFIGVGQWLVFGLDLLLVMGTGGLKWLMEREHTDAETFVRRLVRGWWSVGAAMVVVMHLLLIANGGRLAELGSGATVVVNLLATSAFVAAMTMLLLAVHSDTVGSRTWFLPLVFGTLITQFASAIWEPAIDSQSGCADDISSGYFSSAIEFIALILLAIGVELSYVRRAATVRDATERAAPVLTVILLGAGQLLALSMMIKADKPGRCSTAAVWHEYIAFLVTTQAMAVGLATITWLLITDAGLELVRRPRREVLSHTGSGALRQESLEQHPAQGDVVYGAGQQVRPPGAMVAGHPERLGSPERRQHTEGEVPLRVDEPRQARQTGDQ